MFPRPLSRLAALAAGALLLPAAALAHEVTQDDLRVAHPFATPTPPGAPNGAAYLDITVNGDAPATLVGAESPVSERVEVHDMTMDGDTMQMSEVERLTLEAGETLTMRPGGGHHLMLLGLEAPLVEGESFPLTLEFAEREPVEVEVWVQPAVEGSDAADAHHH